MMLHFRDAPSGVRCLLELRDEAAEEGLPPLHAGLDAGAMIRRDGDYFGSVVNVAARAADHARPNEVLVTGAAARALDDDPGVRLQLIGPIPLKNVSSPVELFQVSRRF
jgi:class 3 adenylate cyclase